MSDDLREIRGLKTMHKDADRVEFVEYLVDAKLMVNGYDKATLPPEELRHLAACALHIAERIEMRRAALEAQADV